MPSTIPTKNSLLTSLYQSTELNEVVQKIPDNIRDDIKQHVFLSLFEQPEENILDLHSRGKLKSYVVRAFYMAANYGESKFLRQNRRKTEIPTDKFQCTPDEDNYDYEELVATCAVKLEAVYWYNRDLLKLYTELGNYRAVAEKTGIPLNSVHDAIKKAKAEVKRMLWE